MVSEPSFMARHGATLVDNGYAILPIMPGTKKPGRFTQGQWVDYGDWSRHCRRPTSEHEIEIWSAWPEAGIGIACGRVVAIDIDMLADGELALELERLCRQRLGDTPALRIGRSPKRLLVYRAAEPFAGRRRAPLEVLGEGRQFVAFALHPDTGQPYVWPDRSPLDMALDDLPVIEEGAALAFLEEAYARVPEALRPRTLGSGRVGTTLRRRLGDGELRGTPEAVAAALACIPNADLDYNSWVRIGMALKGALGDAGREPFEEWSAQSAKDVPETTAKAWASFQPTSIGAGTIYHHALRSRLGAAARARPAATAS